MATAAASLRGAIVTSRTPSVAQQGGLVAALREAEEDCGAKRGR